LKACHAILVALSNLDFHLQLIARSSKPRGVARNLSKRRRSSREAFTSPCYCPTVDRAPGLWSSSHSSSTDSSVSSEWAVASGWLLGAMPRTRSSRIQSTSDCPQVATAAMELWCRLQAYKDVLYKRYYEDPQ